MRIHGTTNYIEPEEFELFMKTFNERYPHHVDASLFYRLSYNHGLRREEAVNLLKRDFNLNHPEFYCKRLKGGLDLPHTLTTNDLYEYNKYINYMSANNPDWMEKYNAQDYLIRTIKMTKIDKFRFVDPLIVLGKELFGQRLKPLDLRHSCAYRLLSNGTNLYLVKQYMGHKSITNTIRYLPAMDKEVSQLSKMFDDTSKEDIDNLKLKNKVIALEAEILLLKNNV